MYGKDYDVCYKCTRSGADYFLNDNGELEFYCPYCWNNRMKMEDA